jgi:AcrR family transcriptional regulator
MELILDSAIKLFCEKGYAETSINDIAEDADFSRTSIYQYFTTKEEIYVRILENYTNLFSERLLEATKRASTVTEEIGVFLDEMRTRINVKPHFFQLYFI